MKTSTRHTLPIFLVSLFSCTSRDYNPPGSDAGTKGLQTRDGKAVTLAKASPALPQVRLCNSRQPLKLGEECKSADEDEVIAKITDMSFRFQEFQNSTSVGVSKRDFHPKQHACVAGVFEVHAGLADDYRRGVFATPKKYSAVVRFSNGTPLVKDANQKPAEQADGVADTRAMAIKVIGVEGESAIMRPEASASTKNNQDFVLVNSPTFFIRNPTNFAKFFAPFSQGKNALLMLEIREAKRLMSSLKKSSDILNETYWSQSPFRLGHEAVKWKAIPCAQNAKTYPESNDGNFLRARAAERIASEDVCYKFLVQKQRNASAHPTEDTTIEWEESTAPFQEVARLTFQRGQNINDKERDSFCEHTSFSPWNAIVDHAPVGGINRIRLPVYSGISNKRRMENKKPIVEPTGTEPFFSVVRN